MDAVEFLKARTRMCNYYMNYCRNCPGNEVEYCATLCANAIDLVPIVEQWAKEHPVKTRQSEMLKLFPSASIDGGALCICPMTLDPETYKTDSGCIPMRNSVECRNCRYFGRELKNGKHDCTDFNLPYCRPDDFCSHGVQKEATSTDE